MKDFSRLKGFISVVMCNDTCYTKYMIISFKHKQLERFFNNNDSKGLSPDQLNRIRKLLSALDAAKNLKDLTILKGYKLHKLKSNLEGFWSMTVTGNYRIIFKFNEEDSEVYDVDYIDSH